jgi:hypothetical protein
VGNFMPYLLEKGPIWSVVESALRRDAQTTYFFLEYLRDTSQPLSLGPIVAASSLNKGPMPTAAERAKHLDEDWFGMVEDNGVWKKQDDKDWDPILNASLGFWVNYWGDVESIVRETFTRACEVSLGLDHEETMTPDELRSPRRWWPITVFLRCPCPWFEGWVSWRRWGSAAGEGEVGVHFNTPGHKGSQVLTDPTKGLNKPPIDNPQTSNDANGMWLITSPLHRPMPAVATNTPGYTGTWTFPTLGLVIKDDPGLKVLCTAEEDGGVAPNGRSYP